jgi:hypothetical protein
MAESRFPKSPDELIRPLHDLIETLQSASRAVAERGARVSARATPDFLAGPLADYVESITELTENLTGPLTKLLEEQQRLAALMAEWAEKHRELSEQIAMWAEQHQRISEQMHQLAAPALAQANIAAETTKAFVEELRK